MSEEHERQPEDSEHANRGKEPSQTPASLSSFPDCGGTGRVVLLTSSRLFLRCESTGQVGPHRVVTATDAVIYISNYESQGYQSQMEQIFTVPPEPMVVRHYQVN